VLDYGHLAPPCAPAVSEHLVPGLLRECLIPAAGIAAEELTRFERYYNRAAQYGEIRNGTDIIAVYLVTFTSAIRTYPIGKAAPRKKTIRTATFVIFGMLYQKVTWRIKEP
jgi:hypothetical protein